MTRSLSLSLSVCLFSGRRVGGQTALEMGLVNRAVEQNQTGDAAYREALTLAREILPQVRMQTHTIPLPQLRDRCIPPHSFSCRPRTWSSPSLLLCFPVCLFTFCFSPFLVFSSPPPPSLSLLSSVSSGLCRSVFLSLQFRWQSSGEMDHK